MSQVNVEIVRAAFEAWNAGDMDALRELLDPGIIWRPPEGWPEPGPFVGRDAVMRWFEQLREAYDTYVTELIGDTIEAADRVAVKQVWRGAGRGPEANIESTGIFTVRKGRIFGVEQFWDHAEALEILGLAEPAMSQNIERLWAMFEAYNRRDFDDALKYVHPEIELHPAITDLPELASPYRGRDEVKRFLETITDHWETQVVEPEETVELPGKRVLVVERWRVRGRQGVEVEFELTEVYTFRDGLIMRIDGFRERAEALEAAGVSE